MINRILLLALAVLIVVLAFQNKAQRAQIDHLEAQRPAKPDTVFVNKPYKVEVIKYRDRAVPVQVKVYQPDTVLRDTMVHDTLISAIKLRKKQLVIDRIDPKGIVYSNKYPLPRHYDLQIDYSGHVRVKKRRQLLKKTGIVVGIGVTVGIGYVLLVK